MFKKNKSNKKTIVFLTIAFIFFTGVVSGFEQTDKIDSDETYEKINVIYRKYDLARYDLPPYFWVHEENGTEFEILAGEIITDVITDPYDIEKPLYEKEYEKKYKNEKKYNSNLPEKYDLRDSGLITDVKDQEDSSDCWAFSIIGAIESNVLKNGFENYPYMGEYPDFSEKHLVRFTQNNFEYEKKDRYYNQMLPDEGAFWWEGVSTLINGNGPSVELGNEYYKYNNSNNSNNTDDYDDPLDYIDFDDLGDYEFDEFSGTFFEEFFEIFFDEFLNAFFYGLSNMYFGITENSKYGDFNFDSLKDSVDFNDLKDSVDFDDLKDSVDFDDLNDFVDLKDSIDFDDLNDFVDFVDSRNFDDSDDLKISEHEKYISYAHVTDVFEVPSYKTDEIKEMIMKYGAGVFSFYSGEEETESNGKTVYYQTYGNRVLADHMVVLAGWDDNFPKEKFENKNVKYDGAWLVRNSWGNYWGNDGYFWISYEEPSLCEFVFFNTTNPNMFDFVYKHDSIIFSSAIADKKSEKTVVANVYEAKESEKIKAVSFYTLNGNVKYNIKIYKNFENVGEVVPDSGELLTEIDGESKYSGYKTVYLEDEIYLKYGDVFSVVLEMQSENENTYIPIEGRDAIYKSNTGFSFYKSGGTWYDLSEEGLNNAFIHVKVENKGYNYKKDLIKLLIDKKNAIESIKHLDLKLKYAGESENYEFLINYANFLINEEGKMGERKAGEWVTEEGNQDLKKSVEIKNTIRQIDAIYEKISPAEYEINYISNFPKGFEVKNETIPDSKTVKSFEKYNTEEENPKVDRHVFIGWSLLENTSYIYPDPVTEIVVTQDLDFYALWGKIPDLNKDSEINYKDLLILIKYHIEVEWLEFKSFNELANTGADINKDGFINMSDVTLMIKYLLNF